MSGHQLATRPHTRQGSRSRKGCPECRTRKIKCDEQTPQCGQCLKTGRVCRIVDSLFKPHSYTFLAQTSPKSKSQTVRAGEKGSDEEPTRNASRPNGFVVTDREKSKPIEARTRLLNQSDRAPTAGTLTGPPLPGHAWTERVALASTNKHPEDSTAQLEETYQDRCEIAFFLRHFCEGPGQWMDICGNQSYFSQSAVVLSHWSPLLRYAACALAAKQLGQTRHPESQIRQTNTQRLMMKALIDTKLGFTWYGAKYYEKAIQLLAQQLSSKDRATNSSSPNHIYDVGLTPNSQPTCENDDKSPGVVISLTIGPVVTHRKTRIDPDDIVLWCKMGLPLDGCGYPMAETPCDAQSETILFKALIRTMCYLVNSDLENATQWSMVSGEFDRWQNIVPPSFYIPITWPPDGPDAGDSVGAFSRETWFANDICAITVAFYHMSRIILLVNRPTDIPVWPSGTTVDLTGTYNALRGELRKHAMEVMAIMHAMPSERVQKYMLQPLYVAGRCLTDSRERSDLLQMLRIMGDDFGLFTDYRIQDLCEEWGMECSGVDRRDGHGILT
ncbi:hypothetical protein BDW68DRAFT_194020 [Aspergillus falconensis]